MIFNLITSYKSTSHDILLNYFVTDYNILFYTDSPIKPFLILLFSTRLKIPIKYCDLNSYFCGLCAPLFEALSIQTAFFFAEFQTFENAQMSREYRLLQSAKRAVCSAFPVLSSLCQELYI